MCNTLFFLRYFQQPAKQANCQQKNLRKILRVVYSIREFVEKLGLIYKNFWAIFIFFPKKKKVNTKNVNNKQKNLRPNKTIFDQRLFLFVKCLRIFEKN